MVLSSRYNNCLIGSGEALLLVIYDKQISPFNYSILFEEGDSQTQILDFREQHGLAQIYCNFLIWEIWTLEQAGKPGELSSNNN